MKFPAIHRNAQGFGIAQVDSSIFPGAAAETDGQGAGYDLAQGEGSNLAPE